MERNFLIYIIPLVFYHAVLAMWYFDRSAFVISERRSHDSALILYRLMHTGIHRLIFLCTEKKFGEIVIAACLPNYILTMRH